MTKQNTHTKIIEQHEKIIIQYTHKIQTKKVTRNKVTENRFHMGKMPPEIIEYFKVQDRTIYFYEKEGIVCITSRRPTIEHQEIKVQKNDTYSIPKTFFPHPEQYTNVILTLDLSKCDDYKNGLGLLSIKLKH